MAWQNPRWNSLTGPDAETLRAIFKSLQDFLARPTFEEGVELGTAGASPTVDVANGIVTPVQTTPIDEGTFLDLGADLSALDDALAQLELDLNAILPITETEIADDAITTPKLAANAVVAGKIAADAVTANEIAADSVTAEQMAAINMAVGKFLRSTTYAPGTAGFSIEADGSAEFNNVKVRGEVEATRFTAVEGSTNLLGPGTFEATAEGWTNAGSVSTVTRSSTQKHSGSWGLSIVKPASSGYLFAQSPTFAVAAGRAYKASLWIYPPSGSVDANPGITWYDATNAIITTEWWGTNAPASVWVEQRSPVLIAPSGATTARLWVRESVSSSAAGTAYIDDVVVTDAPLIRSGAYQSDSAAKRIEIAGNDKVEFKWPPKTTQDQIAGIERYVWWPGAVNEQHQVELRSGSYVGRNGANVRLESAASDGSAGSRITLDADQVRLGSTDIKGAWTPYTPTLKNGTTAVTKTTTVARYQQIGKLVTVFGSLAVTGAGAAGDIRVGLPVTAAYSGINAGFVTFYDASANVAYFGAAYFLNTSEVVCIRDNSTGGNAVATALASGDSIQFSVTYEAA